VEQGYLAISDIWGQKYLRFSEIAPATTTVAPTTTESPNTDAPTTVSLRQAVTETDEATTLTESETTTTEIPTTTAEPLPYDIKTLRIPTDTVYLIQPRGKTEGSYPLMVPVNDFYNHTDNTDEVIVAYNERLHLAYWDMDSQDMNVSIAQWFNSRDSTIEITDFMVPSAAWVDPFGRMLIGTHDIRPFEKILTNSIFTFFPNSFDPESTFYELSLVSCDPSGMAWGIDNSTLYFADSHTKNITKCDYDSRKIDVSNCETLLNVGDEISATATPKGMATDENGHIWVTVADKEQGAVVEIDPETGTVISTIDVEDGELVDIAFAGEDLDFAYILSKKSLYKMTGMGVRGMHVPDFIWKPELKKRSL